MKKNSLIIVESPTKARTIDKILGSDFSIVSSMGHLIDLPKDRLGVDIEDEFNATYVVMPKRVKILDSLKKESKGKKDIYIATDPDREGEAIAWHIMQRLPKNKNYHRVVFHEITDEAIKEAFKKPRQFDLKMVDAQIARRILDRLVGYFLSPLLWRKIARGLSAGRVQSVVLRLIIERERQIQAFRPKEYWQIEAELSKSNLKEQSFMARLDNINGEKIEIKNKQQAEGLVDDIKDKTFKIHQIKETEKRRFPGPPFITSTLQQEAFNRLKFTANKTMLFAQQLYEGIEIGVQGPTGLITYMRTDSTHVSEEATRELRRYVKRYYGANYLEKSVRIFKTKKFAQAAHEAIRPTSVERTPESIKEFLTPDQFKLYELIYKRFLASQMTPMRYKVTTVYIQADKYRFVATGTTVTFDGFSIVYNKYEAEEKSLPELGENEILNLISLIPSQHFTKPPARFSEGSLVKILEQEGIGRPSTYAPIISTLINRDYTRRIKGYFHPTELGFKVCDLLVEYFPKIMDIKFTAQMEEELDEIEEGMCDRLKVLSDFYLPFKSHLDFAQKNIKKEIIISDEICDKCGNPMVIKWGRKGKFLSCSKFPKCKNSKAITTGIRCPQKYCGGELIERRSRRGFFYGCSNFPKCKFTSKNLPVDTKEGKS